MLLEHVACDLCGAPGYTERYRKPDSWLRATPYRFPVVECSQCGLVYVNPRPTPDAMADFYPAGYHDHRDTPDHLRRYAIQRSLLPPLRGKCVLDIGCASGDFLAWLLDQGEAFQAHGIDAFSPGVRDPRIAFVQGVFSEPVHPDAHFDLVMAWAVFEHLHQPSAYFREAARVLRAGGRLVILVTNADSAYGRLAQTEDIPRHTYHYTQRTLAAYGQRSGLALQRVEHRDDIFDGRGLGTFRMLAGRLAGFTWEKEMLGRTGRIQRWAMRAGNLVDRLVFSSHWEARMRRSGIMVATYEKP